MSRKENFPVIRKGSKAWTKSYGWFLKLRYWEVRFVDVQTFIWNCLEIRLRWLYKTVTFNTLSGISSSIVTWIWVCLLLKTSDKVSRRVSRKSDTHSHCLYYSRTFLVWFIMSWFSTDLSQSSLEIRPISPGSYRNVARTDSSISFYLDFAYKITLKQLQVPCWYLMRLKFIFVSPQLWLIETAS